MSEGSKAADGAMADGALMLVGANGGVILEELEAKSRDRRR